MHNCYTRAIHHTQPYEHTADVCHHALVASAWIVLFAKTAHPERSTIQIQKIALIVHQDHIQVVHDFINYLFQIQFENFY